VTRSELREEFAAFRNEIAGRLDRIDTRLDRLDGRMDTLQTTLLRIGGGIIITLVSAIGAGLAAVLARGV